MEWMLPLLVVLANISDARSLGSYGRPNEPMNPCPEWIYRFIWSTIWSEWSRLTDPDSDHLKGTHPGRPCVPSLCSKINNWNSLPLELKSSHSVDILKNNLKTLFFLSEHLVNIHYARLFAFQVHFYCPFFILDVLLVNLKVYACNVHFFVHTL